METKIEGEKPTKEIAAGAEENQSCAVGGCGSGGMCSGVAMAIGLLVSSILVQLLPAPWLGYTIGVVTTVALILGFYPTGSRWPLKRKK